MKRMLVSVIIILLLVAPLPAFATDKVSDWEDFTGSLEEARSLEDSEKAATAITNARNIFEKAFAKQIKGFDSTKLQIHQGLNDAAQAVTNSDDQGIAIGAELAEKTTLGLVFSAFQNDIGASNGAKARPWFDVMAKKLKLDSNHELVKQMDGINENPQTTKKEGVKVIDGLTSKLAGKVTEEVDEALVASDPTSAEPDLADAKIKAAEGVAYFRAMRSQADQKLGAEEAALVAGLLDQFFNASIDEDYDAALSAGTLIKKELEVLETSKNLSESQLEKEIEHINSELANAANQVEAGNVDAANDMIDESWNNFVKIEAQIRKIDAPRYVAIENIFAQIQGKPEKKNIMKLRQTFTEVAGVDSGEREVSAASTAAEIFTNFERIQPILLALLSLIGIYPIYLIFKAFGWAHKAWRNIGIFIVLLIMPVFMETLGRLGVELQIPALQVLSFTANEFAKMAWVLLMLMAFLFAISGLRSFCQQFGVKAIGVRALPEEPFPAPEEIEEKTSV